MAKIVRDFIQVALLVVMISGLTMGCAGLSSTSAPGSTPSPSGDSDGQTVTQRIAEVEVWQLGPREYYYGGFPSGYETPDPWTGWKPDVGEWIYFFVEVKPSNVSAGEIYSVRLLSRSGYWYDSAYISWSAEDMAEPKPAEPGERDIREITEATERLSEWPPSRFVVLRAPYFDKEIEPLRLEFNSRNLEARLRRQAESLVYSKYVTWYDDATTGWLLGGMHLSRSELQEICEKYIEVVVVEAGLD